MDENPLISSNEHKRHRTGEGNDARSSARISDLPDETLVLIISSLPIRHAIQTSVLSKRWVHLWRNISTIELKEETHENRQQFIDFVRKLLKVCDWSSLEKFSLSCKVGKDAAEVSKWLDGFIKPKIQELNLDLKEIEASLTFPDRLFACATLTKFQLRMKHVLKLPPSILFGSLKTLTLEGVKFRDSPSTKDFFYGLFSLEELSLINCNWVDMQYVSIFSPVLRKLIIMEHQEYDEGVGRQHISDRCIVMIIGTNNLKSFNYDGAFTNDYYLYGATSVINASIHVGKAVESAWDDVRETYAGYCVSQLLKQLSSVEKLSITDISLLIIITHPPSLLEYVPVFCNLAELSVVSTTRITITSEGLVILLHRSPCLQVINFEEAVTLLEEDCVDDILDPLPSCFRTHLKTIKVDGLSLDDDGEVLAIKFLLRAASVLETLVIRCYSNAWNSSKRAEILRFPRGSMNCTIDCVRK